ncbi:MAG: hypothetical protein WAK31_21975 [Chthoniobacterales bacterium]
MNPSFTLSLETDVSLSKIVERIILGPSLSSPLARGTVLRMLEALGRPELKDRLKSSSIPSGQAEAPIASSSMGTVNFP